MSITYPTSIGSTPTQGVPTETPSGAGSPNDRDSATSVAVGDALAVSQALVRIDAAQNKTHLGYWVAPYACRVRAIGLVSSQTTDGAGVDVAVTITNGTQSLDLVAATTFDASPVLTADALSLLNASSTPALTNYETVNQNDVVKITAAFSNNAGWADDALQVIFFIEPRLLDTSVSAQTSRQYLQAVRTKDS